MYEFRIWNVVTLEDDFIFGYSEEDAFRRHPQFANGEWFVYQREYVD